LIYTKYFTIKSKNNFLSVDNQIVEHYKKWRKLAIQLLNYDRGNDLVGEVLTYLLTNHREKLEGLAARGELDRYVCKYIRMEAINFERNKSLPLFDMADEPSAIDEQAIVDQRKQLDTAMLYLTYGDRALIRYYMDGHGTIRQLAEATGEDYEYLRKKFEGAKKRLKKQIWLIQS
jgi:hypothetical protein